MFSFPLQCSSTASAHIDYTYCKPPNRGCGKITATSKKFDRASSVEMTSIDQYVHHAIRDRGDSQFVNASLSIPLRD